MDIINKFYIENIEKDGNQVIFFMEDTYNFEVWLLDFEISYIMKHFVDGSLDQIIISIEDYSKIEKYVFTDDKKAEKVVFKETARILPSVLPGFLPGEEDTDGRA